MKRLSKVFVLLFLMTMLASVTVLAEGDQTKYSAGHFYYHPHDGYVSVCGYLGRETDVVIPASISGRPVSEIEGGSFEGCNTIRTITVPDTVVIVHEDSFKGAASLEKIVNYATGLEISVGEGVKVENASNTQSDAQGGPQGDTQGNTQGNTQSETQGDAQGKMQSDIQGDAQGSGKKRDSTNDNSNTAVNGKSENKAETGNATVTDNGGIDASTVTDNGRMDASNGTVENSGLGDFALEEEFVNNDIEMASSVNESVDSRIKQVETAENIVTESGKTESGMTENSVPESNKTENSMTESDMTKSSIPESNVDKGVPVEQANVEKNKSGFDRILPIALACLLLVAVIGGVFLWKGMKDIKQER